MTARKLTKTFYFTVEGETEKWYLDWLQKQINSNPDANYKVFIDSKIERNPLKRVKSMSNISKVEITHLFDFESNSASHGTQFIRTLDLLKEASKLKQIKYRSGYSNLTFELWMVLHKQNCSGSLEHRRNYLRLINRAFDENFENLDQYKQKDNFNKVLERISLSDVISAIRRSKLIMQLNQENGFVLKQYKGYEYYEENPSLMIWVAIKEIVTDCGLI